MDETNPQQAASPPPPSATPSAEGAPPAAPGPVPRPAAAEPNHPGRRRIVRLLVGLYAVSALAGLAILWKGGGGASGPGRTSLTSAKRLLTAAKEPVVGWVSIRGTISQNSSGRTWEKGMEQWSRRIQALADKSEVKAIVLDINSPGGSVGAVQELHDVILRVRKEKKKPVVAVVGDMAASGGYYLAVACDKVVAHPGSLVGSIGVIMESMNVEQLLNKIGVKAEPIKSGKFKDIGSMTRPMTKEERDLLQGIIDNAYGQFLAAVAEGRGLPVDRVRPIADGRIFTGEQAKALGLIDELGGDREALLLAGKLGGILGTPKVARDGESLEDVLEMLDSSLSPLLRPEARFLSEARELTVSGLEYRWTGYP